MNSIYRGAGTGVDPPRHPPTCMGMLRPYLGAGEGEWGGFHPPPTTAGDQAKIRQGVRAVTV